MLICVPACVSLSLSVSVCLSLSVSLSLSLCSSSLCTSVCVPSYLPDCPSVCLSHSPVLPLSLSHTHTLPSLTRFTPGLDLDRSTSLPPPSFPIPPYQVKCCFWIVHPQITVCWRLYWLHARNPLRWQCPPSSDLPTSSLATLLPSFPPLQHCCDDSGSASACCLDTQVGYRRHSE